MADNTKPTVQPPQVHLGRQLLVAAILLIIIGVAVIIAGKFLFGGLLSLLGAVFGVGAQVARDFEF